MIVQAGFNIQIIDSEVVEELPRPVDRERELLDKNLTPDDLKYRMEAYRGRRLKQPHIYIQLKGEAAVPLNDEHAEMMFGKYKGQKLHEVPEHYLDFLVRKGLEDAARYTIEIRRRRALNKLTRTRGVLND